ncbi:MAG: CDP-alcohol phosphatidyltransferase family protein [Deltaproteobacteria bacterium]|nr:CDP-alcohol phosphatidyltransferase family protein [Deltaproteobacteria bacterium]
MFQRGQIKNILSHPNSLTLFRVAAVPIIVILLLFPNRLCSFISALVFSAAAITDFLDGFFARKRGLESNFGKVMDPIADKVLMSTSFIMLASLQWIPAWIVKYKTGFQIASIIPLMIHYPYLAIDFHAIGSIFLWIALVLTVWSGADYFIRFRGLLKL